MTFALLNAKNRVDSADEEGKGELWEETKGIFEKVTDLEQKGDIYTDPIYISLSDTKKAKIDLAIKEYISILSMTENNDDNPYNKLWTDIENQRLIRAVDLIGLGDWRKCAEFVGYKRNAKMCYNHWYYNLNPKINKEPFTKEEDEIIIQKVKEIGKHYQKIANFLINRTKNQVEARFRKLELSMAEAPRDEVRRNAARNQPYRNNLLKSDDMSNDERSDEKSNDERSDVIEHAKSVDPKKTVIDLRQVISVKESKEVQTVYKVDIETQTPGVKVDKEAQTMSENLNDFHEANEENGEKTISE